MHPNESPADRQLRFARTYNHYFPLLIAFDSNMIDDLPAAEDIVAETLIRLWDRYEKFDTELKVKAFLYISTKNACINYQKQSKRQAIARHKYSYHSYRTLPCRLEEIIHKETIDRVLTSLENLPPRTRHILLLSFSGGLKNLQIARQLDIAPNTAKNLKYYGINKLKKNFEIS